jgi:hypothetical protein
MLGWIKGTQSDHPLADDRAARELIAELPANDSIKCLEELAYWLDSIRAADDLKVGRLLEIADLIDSASKNHYRKLSQEYLTGRDRLQKFQENRIWTTVFRFWKHLALAYEHILGLYQSGASGWGSVKGQVPVIVSRGLRAGALQLKWHLLRYGPVEPGLWGDLCKLYAYAEGKGLATSSVEVYPGKFGASTAQREFLKSMMLSISSTDSLNPVKLEIAERVVAQFSEFFLLQKEASRGTHYFVDLDASKSPARLVQGAVARPGMRFFGPGTAAGELEKLIVQVRADGAVPSWLNLGGEYEPGKVMEVLKHLARYWAASPPARADERRSSVDKITVVHDFDEIISTISGNSADLSFDSIAESWAVENESDGGYGAILAHAKSEWLKVGTLLGVRLEDGASWGVGIVRRLSSIDEKNRYVGIQVLAKGATVVELAPVNAIGSRQSAVLLPSNLTETTGTGEMNLLLRMGAYAPQKSFEMRAYDRTYLLVPRRLMEGGHDFDMARYRIMQRAA